MIALGRNPRFWLAAQMVLLVVFGGAFGLFTVRIFGDSTTYLAAAEMSLDELLCYHRTVGYPLLLKIVAPLSPDYGIIPWVHLAVFFPAVFLLDFAVRRYGASPWQAFAVSTGFFWAALQNRAVNFLGTDFLGIVTAVIAISFLLWVSAAPRRVLPWIGLTVSLACSYHVRPAYLFLVGLVPCLGVVFLRIRAAWAANRWSRKKFAAVLCGVSVLPYLGYALARFLLVGHFGLVSFGGYGVVALAVELIDREMIETELSDRWRPLAADILQVRHDRGQQSVFRGGGVIKLRQWELRYCDNINEVVMPLAVRHFGPQQVTLNRELADFSLEVIGLRKGRYLLFLAYSFPRALAKVVYCGRAVQALGALAAVLLAVRVLRFGRRSPAETASENSAQRGVKLAVFWLAALFLITKTWLVILVVPSISRHMLPAAVFVPSVLAILVWQELERIRPARRLPEKHVPAGGWKHRVRRANHRRTAGSLGHR